MEEQDFEPRHKKPQKRDLTPFSVAELQDYVAQLEAEAARARAMIAEKEKGLAGAETLFKKR